MTCEQRILASLFLTVVAPLSGAQEKPLPRRFTVGAAASYRIQLIVRSELQGQQAEAIGAKTYVKAFTRAAEDGLAWTATRRIASLGADGSAEIEETLADFEPALESSGDFSASADEATAKLAAALRKTLETWQGAHTLRCRETRAGNLLELRAEGVPTLGEAPPRVLTLWLLRALRPTAALPDRPVRFGEPWQELRTVDVPPWSDVRASESGEWLDAPLGTVPAVRLHIVQQISGSVASGPEKPPEGASQARFHGEALNTVSLLDSRLLGATRSAAREIIWTLALVEGLPEPPQFRARLSVEVQIEACDETPCSISDRGRLTLRKR